MGAISKVLGSFLKLVYDFLAGVFPAEPENISFFALSIIIATIVIKLAVIPLTLSQIKNQKKMAELQPELNKLKEKYKNDPQVFAQKQQQLMKDANYNMLTGCLPMIIQLVVLMAFYRVFWDPTAYAFSPELYADMNKNFFFIQNLENIDTTLVMTIIAAVTTFLTSFITMKNPAQQSMQNDQTKGMNSGMLVAMPIMIFMMGRKMKAGLVLYWIVSNLFAIVQQLITNAIVSKTAKAEEVK